ncbi:MAG: hypothetical protein IIC23_06495 [Chloroflexi bacterium]|nr:hypothetical protein [Chloroflexota bacterium]
MNSSIDEFILPGYPHLEKCRRVGSEVLPMARELINAERQDRRKQKNI